MQMVVYMFLSRKRDQDIPRMKRVLSYLHQVESNPNVFLFPEGTDLSRSNKKKSYDCKYLSVMINLWFVCYDLIADNYFVDAITNHLQPMEYVLFPKTGGLQATLSLVRARQMIIHDITLGYVDFEHGQRTSELSLLKGWLLYE